MKTVYWSPWYIPQDNEDWNLLFEEPENLLKETADNYKKNYSNDKRLIDSLRCPAISNVTLNTFFSRNPLRTELNIVNGNIEYKGIHHYNSSLNNELGNTLTYGLPFIFFCETDLEMLFTGPYYSETKHTNYATLIPGRFNISKWFRPINLEFLIKDKYFKIEENEIMCYFNFLTNERVVLKRFVLNDKLLKISQSCSSVNSWWQNIPLIRRYDRFVKTKTNKIVMKEIEKQIIC